MAEDVEDLAYRLIAENWCSDASSIPSTVYHYTNAAGLLGILKNRAIWITEYRFLNDVSEVNLGLKRADQVLSRMVSSETAALRKSFLVSVREEISQSNQQSGYVASFTDRKDDLSQWRGYANDGHGFAIGFDAPSISLLTKTNEFSFGKVNYNSRAHDAKIRSSVDSFLGILDEYADENDGDLSKAVDECEAVLHAVAASYKHSSFQNENEWRIHCYPSNGNIDVRARGSSLIPYYEMDETDFGGDFPIREIGIGPAFGSSEHTYAVERLLEKTKIAAKIYRANTPFRAI